MRYRQRQHRLVTEASVPAVPLLRQRRVSTTSALIRLPGSGVRHLGLHPPDHTLERLVAGGPPIAQTERAGAAHVHGARDVPADRRRVAGRGRGRHDRASDWCAVERRRAHGPSLAMVDPRTLGPCVRCPLDHAGWVCLGVGLRSGDRGAAEARRCPAGLGPGTARRGRSPRVGGASDEPPPGARGIETSAGRPGLVRAAASAARVHGDGSLDSRARGLEASQPAVLVLELAQPTEVADLKPAISGLPA
jgi:hypothetical protein